MTSTSYHPSLPLHREVKTSLPSSPNATKLPLKKLNFSLLFSNSFAKKGLIVARSSSTAKYDEVLVDEDVEKVKRLQNGSDVRGVALEGEKGRSVDLTPPAMEAIAMSFGEWVIRKLEKEGRPVEVVKISLGRDPRVSGATLSVAVFAGLSKAGCLAFDMGLATTPACFMSTVLPPFSYDASIMMTASHLPYTRNGLKFFTKKGGLTSPEVEEICGAASRKYANRQAKVSTMISPPVRVDFMSVYTKHLRDIIKQRVNHPLHYDTPLQGFEIIVNAGNGSGGFFTYDVLDKLGADTFGSLHLNPDGMFPNHIPNPEDKKAMAMTRAAVLQTKADLGIVFDTDVDRSGVVDSEGNPINGDKLIALMSAIVLREHPGSTVVTDARTSMALTRFIAARGGQHCMYRVGYRNVIDKGVQLNKDGIDSHLMMETSGHGALKENYYLDDAMIVSVTLEDEVGAHELVVKLAHLRWIAEMVVKVVPVSLMAYMMVVKVAPLSLMDDHNQLSVSQGAYMVVKIIIEMVKMKLEGSNEGIGCLIKDLEEPLESVELRMDIVSEPRYAKAKGIEAIETFSKYVMEGKLKGWELDSCGDCWVSEGCLVDSNDAPSPVDAQMYRAKVSDDEHGQHGWVHIRQSIHNPNIAINMQSSMPGGCQSMAQVLRDAFLFTSGLDCDLDISHIDTFAQKGYIG